MKGFSNYGIFFLFYQQANGKILVEVIAVIARCNLTWCASPPHYKNV